MRLLGQTSTCLAASEADLPESTLRTEPDLDMGVLDLDLLGLREFLAAASTVGETDPLFSVSSAHGKFKEIFI